MDEFVKRVAKCDECIHNSVCFMQEVCNDIEEQLREFGCDHYRRTADVVEVKHGWWLQNGMCSECLVTPDTSHKGYCPNCGAKMDGKRKDGEQA